MRVFSFAQESTRYCNYSKNKFNNELTFIIPSWIDIPEGNYTYWDGDWCDVNKMKIQLESDTGNCIDHFLTSLSITENYYTCLINNGWSAQQARQVLSNAIKTEICMTGFIEDWKHFFYLRFFGYTGKPHPDMQKLASELFFKMIYLIDYTGYELDEMIRKGFSDVAKTIYKANIFENKELD